MSGTGHLAKTVQRDGTTVPVERGHLEQNIRDRTTLTGPLGQDIQDRTVSKGQPDKQPGQLSQERTEMTGLPGHDSGVRRAVAHVAWAGQLE
jgi:hypothetical protein